MSRKPFTVHSGVAAPLLVDNIDTDQIIPSREMKTVSRNGLSDGLFAGWRYASPTDRTPRPEFVLNQKKYAVASILLGGDNFGCGSSREHAVWALTEYGIRAIVAIGFGDIFRNNCVRNGLLPIKLPDLVVRSLADFDGEVVIDLPSQTLSAGPNVHAFDIDSYAKRLLVEGLDPISLTQQHQSEIEAYFADDKKVRPWL
ncbi:MAG: 3-isopropylmalate dehydratase small subunit [Pseudomonadota bacterium]